MAPTVSVEQAAPSRVRFGAFELDLKSGELWSRAEGRILLREQSFQVLRMLLEREGKIVVREEIKKTLWPNDTVVDFDHSINTTIKTLRRALGDSADHPQYIETLARRGYRLMVAVEWVESPADSPPASVENGQTFLAPGELIGKKVSHYRVLRAIGGGGMGMVFEAEDLRLGRRVALKFLPEELATDPVSLRRFSHEARTASALNHPNICTIYEIEDHQGQPFIVMELLEGVTLQQRMAAPELKAFPVTALLDIAIQIADGLQAAHGKGIIHRDIKPANIFVTNQGSVKILDFGIAKMTSSQGTGEEGADVPSERPVSEPAPEGEDQDDDIARLPLHTSLTRTGTTAGTAGYMSPEQVRKETLDPRTDLFSFGLVIYQMATGQRAFTGETVEEVHHAILSHTPEPARSLNPAVPAELDAVIEKALQKDRSLRYQSASDMRADLKRLKAAADPNGRAVVPSAKPILPQWVWVAAGAALIVVIVFAAWLRSTPGTTVGAIAVLPFANATNLPDSEYLSDGITEDLINTLSELPNMKVVARSTVFRFKSTNEDPTAIGRELKVDAVLTGRVSENNGELNIQTDLINTADGTEMWGAKYSRPRPNLMMLRGDIVNDVTARLRTKVSGEQREAMSRPETNDSRAYDLYLKGRFYWNQRGRENLEASIAAFEQAIVADPAFALAYSGLADAYSIAPPYGVSTPKEAHALALAAATKAVELRPGLSEAHTAMGTALAHTRQWEVAEKEFQRSLQLNPGNANAHYFYAFEWLTPMNRLEEAASQYRAALEIDPLSPIINGNYGVLLYMQRKYDAAMEQLKKTAALQPGFAVTSLRMGDLLALEGDFKNADIQRHAYFPDMTIPQTGDARSYGLETIAAISRLTGYQPPYLTAEAWVWAGDKDKAFENLRAGCAQEDNLEPVFLRSPAYDPLRSDQRYAEVTACLRIPQ